MPKPKLTKEAIEGKVPLRTFGELSALFAAKREEPRGPKPGEPPTPLAALPPETQPPAATEAPPPEQPQPPPEQPPQSQGQEGSAGTAS